MKLRLMFYRNSVGWIRSSCVPVNSMMFTCWLIVGSQLEGSVSGSGGRGSVFCDDTVNSTGSSSSDLVSDCVIDDCDDNESTDAVGDSVGDDAVVIDGMIVSAQEHAVKRLL